MSAGELMAHNASSGEKNFAVSGEYLFSDELALLPVTTNDVFYEELEGILKTPRGLIGAGEKQVAADAFAHSGQTFRENGFYLRAAELHIYAVSLYDSGDIVAQEIGLIDAIDLLTQALHLTQVAKEKGIATNIRATYPNSFKIPFSQKWNTPFSDNNIRKLKEQTCGQFVRLIRLATKAKHEGLAKSTYEHYLDYLKSTSSIQQIT
jgi:hypothetical protein